MFLFSTFSIFDIEFKTFPFIILLGFTASVITYVISKKYNKFYLSTLLKTVIPTLIGAAIGARLFSAITLLTVSEQPFWYNLVYGGSVFYGGVIGGAIGLCIICLIKLCEVLVFSDLIVTILPIGHAIGRIGCYCNGCCYGSQYDGFLAVDYVVDGVNMSVFPTWFVEACFCLIIFIYFQLIHKTNTSGVRTAIYCITYSVYRFIIEFMRGDEIRGFVGSLSSSQLISIFVLFAGFLILYISLKNKTNNYLFNEKEKVL